MKPFHKLILLLGFGILAFPTMAQYGPAYHLNSTQLYLMGGYQFLSHPSGSYNVATLHAEVLYSNIYAGTRVGLSYGKDYLSFSVAGLLMFPTALVTEHLNDINDPYIKAIVFCTALSAWQFRVPLDDQLELNFGWDALKFTKLKNYSNTYYITGSLNAGVTWFLSDMFLVSGYYEFNHPHGSQPKILKGHSFGVRTGLMF